MRVSVRMRFNESKGIGRERLGQQHGHHAWLLERQRLLPR